ncbi:P-loop containing nucleoside triphosphate hydrolase protein [Hesseltinella vesiculosa]|uniref:P-loop containing nucleoside triphosphate hydrolase protein n=1 Tax=Hesseltinella vesiculosa TaxID=101127 RepID=A0A1X2G496_9FUNG|nr:P-loop containing nucleoside triphosphate hydrolase protein [Hesseltinella vesiculosa]
MAAPKPAPSPDKPKIKKQKLLETLHQNGATLDGFIIKPKPNPEPAKYFQIFAKKPLATPCPPPAVEPASPLDDPAMAKKEKKKDNRGRKKKSAPPNGPLIASMIKLPLPSSKSPFVVHDDTDDSLTQSLTKISVSDAIAQPSKASVWTEASRSYIPPLKPMTSAAAVIANDKSTKHTKSLPAPLPDRDLFMGGHIHPYDHVPASLCPVRVAEAAFPPSLSNRTDALLKQGPSFLASWKHRWQSPPLLAMDQDSPPSDLADCMASLDMETLMDQLYPLDTTPGWRYPACEGLLEAKKPRDPTLLWCEKYLPSTVDHLLDNMQHHRYLRDWLERHKVATKRDPVVPGKKPTRRQMESHYQVEGQWPVEDDDDDDFMPVAKPSSRKLAKRKIKKDINMCLLVGAPGIGKTASVLTAASETGYQVFEVHPGVRRGHKEIMHLVGDMTQNHQVRFHHDVKKARPLDSSEDDAEMDTPPPPKHQLLTNFFASNTTKPAKPKQEAIAAPSSSPLPSSASKQSLVLFEHVDLLYPSDKNFWNAVVDLAKISKRPILLTCNDDSVIPYDQLQLQAVIHYEPPQEALLKPYLHLICLLEGFAISSQELQGLIHLIGLDLRQLLTTLEFLAHHHRHASPRMVAQSSYHRHLTLWLAQIGIGWNQWLHCVPNLQVGPLTNQLLQLDRLDNSPEDRGEMSLDDLQTWFDLRSWVDGNMSRSMETLAQVSSLEQADEDELCGYGHFRKQASALDHWEWDTRMETLLLNWHHPDLGLLDTMAWECVHQQRVNQRLQDQLDAPVLLNYRTTRVLAKVEWMDPYYYEQFDRLRKAQRKSRRRLRP